MPFCKRHEHEYKLERGCCDCLAEEQRRVERLRPIKEAISKQFLALNSSVLTESEIFAAIDGIFEKN